MLSLGVHGPAEPLLIAAVIFVVCLLGIATRPVGLLATFWPANAVLVGLILRSVGGNRLASWLLATLAMIAADLLTGANPAKTLLLNLANIASAAGTLAVLARFPRTVIEMRGDISVQALVFSCLAGSAVGGLCGMVANPVLFDGSVADGFKFWFATELVNYIAVLPVILSMPRASAGSAILRLSDWRALGPLATLVLAASVCVFIGGPVAILFMVPALLWCATTYSVFVTSLLTAGCSVLALSVLVATYVPAFEQSPSSFAVVSFRLGVAFVALSAIMLSVRSSLMAGMLERLQDSANRDPLTGLNNRRAFMDRAGARVADDPDASVLLMLDIDRFKRINDTFGHAGGDRVLREFSVRLESCLRQTDLTGRMGGEEFCVLLHPSGQRQARVIAERIRRAISDAMFKLDDGISVRITVSIGMAACPPQEAFADTLKRTDAALYEAKKSGRNRVTTWSEDPS